MRTRKLVIVSVLALFFLAPDVSHGALTFYVDPNSPWPAGWYNAAVADMQTTVNMYNAYGDFGSGSIYVYYNSGIPTAQSGYGGSGGSIGVGGTYPNVRVLLHESSHWLGTGTYSANWSGPHASALIQQFDGVGAILNGDSQHYWPYGENYDTESSPINDLRHVAMVYALREDFGIGSTASPSSATNVTLTASDTVGTSSFNYSSNWSDSHFAQPGTAYSTGNFTIRTPLDSNTPSNPTPSFDFVGDSLTVNNTNGSNGGLVFQGVGTNSILNFKNLILNGGYVRQASSSTDLFQIAGKVTLAQSPTIDAAQGNIKILADINGSGSLTKAGAYTLTLTGAGTYSGDTTINAGTLQLSSANPVASYTFDSISGSTVLNSGTGGAAMNGTLAGGATIVSGGRFGNAVSLANGASVNINNPITDLRNFSNWTVSAWVKTTTPGSSILTKGDGSTWTTSNTIFYLGDGTSGGSGGTPSSVRYAGGFFQSSTGAKSVTNNAWHQVTYVDSGGTYSMYVDGVVQPLSSGNSGFGNVDVGAVVRLGATTDTFAGDGTVNFNGLMDNVQFYSQALSPLQVAAIYQGKNLTGTLPSTTNVSIAASAALDLNNTSQTIASLAGPSGSAVKLGNGQLTVSSVVSTSFAGAISGNGGSLVKTGSGTLTLSGVNTYTGATTINGGILRLNSPITVTTASPLASYSFSHISGSTVINDGSGGSSMNGTLNLNGGTGSINTTAGPGSGMGALILNGNGTTVDVNSSVTNLSNSSTWTVSAWIRTTQAGATILDKGDGANWNSGFSTFYLGNGNNAGSGGVPDAVRWGGGWIAGSTSVNDGQWHLLTYTDTAGASAVYVDGALQTLSQNQFFNTDTGNKIRIGFAPTNVDGEVPTNGSLSGINIYNTALSAAQVAALYNSVVGASTPLPATTDVSIASDATLDVNGLTQQIGSLTGSVGSSVTLGSGQLIINSALSTQFGGAISGSGSLVKAGSGTLTLAGMNTYAGTTTVNGGTLRVLGSVAGAVTVNSGGDLQGSGSIGGLVTIANGATLAPGSSPGLLTVGSLNLNAGSQTQIELGGTVRGAKYDAIDSAGSMTLGGMLSVSLINSFVPMSGEVFDLFSTSSTLNGKFAGVQLPKLAAPLGWDLSQLYTTGAISATAYLRGDLNRDGQVTAADISSLMLALSDLNSYQSTTSLSLAQLTGVADINQDGVVTNGDIQALINLVESNVAVDLISGDGLLATVPEPSSLMLLVLAILLMSAYIGLQRHHQQAKKLVVR